MKKWLLVLFLIGALVWLYLHPNTWRHIETMSIPGLTQEKEMLYRWRDNTGLTHYTDEPPADGIDYQVVQFDPDANIVPSTKTE